MLLAAVAFLAPIVERVAFVFIHLVDIGREAIGAAQRSSLAGLDRVATAVAACLSFAFPHLHNRAASIFAGLEAIFAGPQNGKCLVGSIHFEDFLFAEPSHAETECAGVEMNVNGMVG